MPSKESQSAQMTSAVLQAAGQSLMPPPSRTPSGGFKTKEGTLYVSKPFRSSSSQKLRAMIAFRPRKSHFDIGNESSGTNEFRGFFSLFWVSMFLFAVRTYIRSIEANGYALDFAFFSMFSRHAVTLALSDFVLVLSTGLCVPFAKAISKGWIRYHWMGLVLQHVWQAIVLMVAVKWTFNRHWPWVQSGYLTLHSLVMIMKMHSYMSTNGYLQSVHTQAEETLSELHRLTADESIGGYKAAVAKARETRKRTDELTTRESSDDDSAVIVDTPERLLNGGSPTPPQEGTPIVPEGSTTSYIDPQAAVILRQRLNITAGEWKRSEEEGEGVTTTDSGVGIELTSSSTVHMKSTGINPLTRPTFSLPNSEMPSPTSPSFPNKNNKPTPHPLVDHPDERISSLAKEYSEMELELVSSGPEYVRWPENITLKNFAVYQLIPTLVYELEYPRTDRIRPLYVFEKTVAFFGTFALLYTITERFILPLTPSPDQSFFRSLLDLALPFMAAYLLLFYIIFECICNGFAELSYFADRRFYDDWWNSTSWDEFSRKWNRPVHTFLLRHVYASTMTSYKLSRRSAMFLTFLLSAAVHELVMAVVTKKIRMYLFTMQLCQIPLIAIGNMPVIKKNKLLGNVVFWIGLYAGFPLLCVAYCAY